MKNLLLFLLALACILFASYAQGVPFPIVVGCILFGLVSGFDIGEISASLRRMAELESMTSTFDYVDHEGNSLRVSRTSPREFQTWTPRLKLRWVRETERTLYRQALADIKRRKRQEG